MPGTVNAERARNEYDLICGEKEREREFSNKSAPVMV